MNTAGMEWERLNAYVDGELPPDEAARVAEAVARDPDLARQVAALTSLKAAVADSSPPHPGTLALDSPAPSRPARAWLALAASVLLLAGTAAWFAELHRSPPGLDFASALHQDWIADRAAKTAVEAASAVQVGLDAPRFAYVPDLTQVQLEFDGVRHVEARGGRGLHVGYFGPRGCAVSLVVFEQPGWRDEPLTRHGDLDPPAWSWSAGGATFYLLAPAMDPLRLASIAKVVQRLTRARLPLDTEGMLVLDEGRAGAAPCLT